MSSAKRVQYHNIPFQIDGKAKIVKSVTKYTTCNDVISKLPTTGQPLAVFQSVNGEEKELAGKAKLLKVWRSHGSSKKVVFIVKASEGVKERRLSLNIFGNKHSRKSIGPVSKDKIKQVTDLAFYVQYQKSKLQKITTKKEVSDQKVIQKVKSTSSVDSMDAFLAKADLKKMGQFLDFCSGVTASQLGKTPKLNAETQMTRSKVNKDIIGNSLKTMKLGFKKFTSKASVASKSTSASTIKSTDTGYQSRASDIRSQASDKSRPIKRHTFIDADSTVVQRQSTPAASHFKRDTKRHPEDDTLDVTLTPKTANFDEEEGKSELMKRFMLDTTTGAGNKTNVNVPVNTRGRNIQHSLPRNMYQSAPILFEAQEEKFQFYRNQDCEFDNESLCSDADAYLGSCDLDAAILEDCCEINDGDRYAPKPTPKKLRRESAVSNLNMFDTCAKPFDDTVDSEPKDTGFNYSFDCTFAEFSDSQDFSLDYSCSETESDLSSSFEDNYVTRVKDDDFDSFMKSTLAINERSKEINQDSEEKKSDVGSDEGLGSMASDSFSNDGELFI